MSLGWAQFSELRRLLEASEQRAAFYKRSAQEALTLAERYRCLAGVPDGVGVEEATAAASGQPEEDGAVWLRGMGLAHHWPVEPASPSPDYPSTCPSTPPLASC